jgi:hypothetical protein
MLNFIIYKHMKKKLFFGMAGLAFVAAAAITSISTLNANAYESDLLTKNIEALSNGESGSVTCCWDPGDECAFPGEKPVHNYDEC